MKNINNTIEREAKHVFVYMDGKGLDLKEFLALLPKEARRSVETNGFKIRSKEVRTCCICGKKFYGYGNNANPVVVGGFCCDECDMSTVIPTRISRMSNGLSPQIAK